VLTVNESIGNGIVWRLYNIWSNDLFWDSSWNEYSEGEGKTKVPTRSTRATTQE